MTNKLYTYKVAGGRFARFPLDMLRYDRAWPTSTEDAMLILANTDREERNRADLPRHTEISLTSVQPPTIKRWDSFNWRVVED